MLDDKTYLADFPKATKLCFKLTLNNNLHASFTLNSPFLLVWTQQSRGATHTETMGAGSIPCEHPQFQSISVPPRGRQEAEWHLLFKKPGRRGETQWRTIALPVSKSIHKSTPNIFLEKKAEVNAKCPIREIWVNRKRKLWNVRSFHRCEGVEMARTHSWVKWVVYKTHIQCDPNVEFKVSRIYFPR